MLDLRQLPKTCVCIGYDEAARSEAVALASCEQGESLLELRIDMLADPSAGPGIVRRVVSAYPEVSVVATCRLARNGGHFNGSIDEQLSLLLEAVDAGASIVDVEIETLEQAPGALRSFVGRAATLASFHDFERTPDLGEVMLRLDATGADIHKVATQVRRPTDNASLLELCRERPNLVVAGMGATGSTTRLLSPSRGGLFSYVAPDPLDMRTGSETRRIVSLPTAPGQVPASAARKLYRLQEAGHKTAVFAVIAKPVGHSKSPLIHNSAFKATGFDGLYVPMLVEPGHIEDFFRLLRALPLTGVSVTIPHKRSVMHHLDAVDASAQEIGAVNTIHWDMGRLVGSNTDANGITAPLSKRVRLKATKALVVGNGGAAKAAVVALKRKGANVVVTGRNPRRVGALARHHGVRACEFPEVGKERFDILVQATPVGMTPDSQGNLFPSKIPAEIVFDLVYNPLETALLRHAAAEGKEAISGIEMFVEQAAAQFRIWTGMDAPVEAMRRAVLEDLAR